MTDDETVPVIIILESIKTTDDYLGDYDKFGKLHYTILYSHAGNDAYNDVCIVLNKSRFWHRVLMKLLKRHIKGGGN